VQVKARYSVWFIDRASTQKKSETRLQTMYQMAGLSVGKHTGIPDDFLYSEDHRKSSFSLP